MALTRYQIKETAQLYHEATTFSFIQEVTPRGEELVHNGFVHHVHDDFFQFFDVVNKRLFPVPFDKCTDIAVSQKRDMTVADARKVYDEFKTQEEQYVHSV